MRTQNNYFTMPNEVFQLGLSAGELAVYSYLRRCEDRRTKRQWKDNTVKTSKKRAAAKR